MGFTPILRKARLLAALLTVFVIAPVTSSQAQPDVIVGSLQAVTSYGNVGSIYAYAVGTTSCNIGNQVLQWQSSNNLHPVIGQQMYRVSPDGQFDQIGISWLKHGFCALSQTLCGPCSSTSCPTLGVGCSDPYTATRNGTQSTAGPRSQVNAYTGVFPYPFSAPTAQATIGRRLQVQANDINPAQNPGALYYVEGHYVTQDDAQAGNGTNNVSYRRINVSPNPAEYEISLAPGFSTVQEEPAIYAWQDIFSDVEIEIVEIPGEGRLYLGYRVSDNGDGTWHYEYCLYNMNSDISADSFAVPIPAGIALSNVEFNGVPYHSGEPYSTTPWTMNQSGSDISWSTQDFATNPNANALRWSRLYTFRFDAPAGPTAVTADIGLFKTGGSVTVSTMGPDGNFINPPSNLVCASTPTGIQLDWVNGENYDNLEVRRDGTLLATLPGSDLSYFDGTVGLGQYQYEVNGIIGPDSTAAANCIAEMEPQLSFSFPSGQPALLASFGSTIDFQIDEINGGTYEPGSARLFYDAGVGFQEVIPTDLGGLQFSAAVPGQPCGTEVTYYMTAESAAGFAHADPASAPTTTHSAIVADEEVTFASDDMETDQGWTVGAAGDNATTGIWVRGNPIGTDAQPENDHGAGTNCWFTGQGPAGGGLGDNDVDGGQTTLVTPAYDLSSSVDPTISYWRWYSNDEGSSPNSDVFVVEISANGSTWVEVEQVGPTGAQSSGNWFQNVVRVADFVAPSATVQLRFVASDFGGGSIVEAAIDDVEILDLACFPAGNDYVRGDCNQDGATDLVDVVSFLDYLFLGGAVPGCLDACDFNDDGSTSLIDAVYHLVYQFESGAPPPAPFPSCGIDATPDDALSCSSFSACP